MNKKHIIEIEEVSFEEEDPDIFAKEGRIKVLVLFSSMHSLMNPAGAQMLFW